MKTWVRHSLNVGALTAGALLASGAAAQAQPAMVSTDNVGIGNGTQLFAPIQAPVNLCGNAVAVVGSAIAGCQGGSAATLDPEWGFEHFQMASTGNIGVANGTQVFAPIQAPVNVCGNAVAVAGAAAAGCEGGADANIDLDPPKPKHHGNGYGNGHGNGHGNGNGKPGHGYEQTAAAGEVVATATGTPTMLTSGNLGVLNGTQAAVPVQIPINICGNAIAVLGVATAACEGGATTN